MIRKYSQLWSQKFCISGAMPQSEYTSITDIAVYKQSELVPVLAPLACWEIVQAFLAAVVFFFYLILYIPVNTYSVMSGQVFLG